MMKTMITILLLFYVGNTFSQNKEYKIGPNGDTINTVNKNGLKVGKWVHEVPALREEPGYVEEGFYVKGQKDSIWRIYNWGGDLIAVENYKLGGKSGIQQYYNYLGDLEREENWRPYNPEDPYDTIAVYGEGNGEIVDYKIVKAETYSVKDGEWKYYEPGSGRVLRTETWDRNYLVTPKGSKSQVKTYYQKSEKVEKTQEMIEWEKKNGKKKVIDGRTNL